jgi:threonine aldolase
MIFASDNWAGASEKVMAALAAQAKRGGPAYGHDATTRLVERRLSEVFEREVAVFFVATGTAANALALSAYARPGGIAFSHVEAHVIVDEPGSVELFGGIRVVGLAGAAGKIAPDSLQRGIARFPEGNSHNGRPVAVSLSQLTELGAAYAADEIAAITAVARRHGLAVHMDGARFAAAVAGLDKSPADLTWRAGVDVLSFGGTKNGCVAAEAVVFFAPGDAAGFALARQRAGHTFSKSWSVAAQLDAYLDQGHWLDLARQANAGARRLAETLRAAPDARLLREPDGNEVFAVLSKGLDQRLRAAGAIYHHWSAESLAPHERPAPDEVFVRLVASFSTPAAEIDAFAAALWAAPQQ